MSYSRAMTASKAHPAKEPDQSAWRELKEDVRTLAESVNSIQMRMQAMSMPESPPLQSSPARPEDGVPQSPSVAESTVSSSKSSTTELHTPVPSRRQSWTSRIILTTYPGQAGIRPLPLSWAHPDPKQRGPVVVSRHHSTIGRRNGRDRLAPMVPMELTRHFSHRRPRWLIFNLPCACCC